MGLNRDSIAFLLASHAAGVSFERTLVLGRQFFVGDERDIEGAFADAGRPIDRAEARRLRSMDGAWCEPLFEFLGAQRIDSIDASDYEQATIVHDLNVPLPAELHGQYTCVIDGGTLEHVFNFPVALRSALEAVGVGGHYIALTPTNNHFGHGFYQVSPELYFRVLSPENGFHTHCALMRSYNTGARWYKIIDPQAAGGRVITYTSWPTVMYVLASRSHNGEILASYPQQSDYLPLWERRPPTARERRIEALRRRLSRIEPLTAKRFRYTVGTSILRRTPGGFRAVRVADLPSLLD